MENGTTAVRVTQLCWLTPVGLYLLENFESSFFTSAQKHCVWRRGDLQGCHTMVQRLVVNREL
jgi:hypothetical protein